MHLSIDIDQQKSTLFLDLLNLLKKDQMINNFEVLNDAPKLSEYEQEVIDDISHIAETIKEADNGYGKKRDLKITL